MQVYILLCYILLLSQPCSNQVQRISEEESALRDIVFMRTEGLLMTQMLEKNSKNKDVLKICKQVKVYYKQTQPQLLAVTQGKDLKLDESQFATIAKEVEKKFENYNVNREDKWIDMYKLHIHNSIRVYSLFLQRREWVSVTYFSFKALPELINLELEFNKLDIK